MLRRTWRSSQSPAASLDRYARGCNPPFTRSCGRFVQPFPPAQGGRMSPSRRFLLVLACFMAAAIPARGQTSPGGIAGVVRDESGAAVPAAIVTITDARTGGIARILASGPNGAYAVPNLSPGLYVVSAELKGFGKAAQNVRVSAGDTMKADFTLSAMLEAAVPVSG